MSSRPLIAPAIVYTPLNNTYQPIMTAITSNVGAGHAHTKMPRPTSSSPAKIDQPAPEPSTGVLNIDKNPRNTNSAPTKNARSATVQSAYRIVTPAPMLTTPMTSNIHQRLATCSTAYEG